MEDKYGLRFSVYGSKYKGNVAVLYDGETDAFEIVLLNQTPVHVVSPVYFDELVDRINELVAQTADGEGGIVPWLDMPNEDPDEEVTKTIDQYLWEAQRGDTSDVFPIG